MCYVVRDFERLYIILKSFMMALIISYRITMRYEFTLYIVCNILKLDVNVRSAVVWYLQHKRDSTLAKGCNSNNESAKKQDLFLV